MSCGLMVPKAFAGVFKYMVSGRKRQVKCKYAAISAMSIFSPEQKTVLDNETIYSHNNVEKHRD